MFISVREDRIRFNIKTSQVRTGTILFWAISVKGDYSVSIFREYGYVLNLIRSIGHVFNKFTMSNNNLYLEIYFDCFLFG